MNRRLNLLAAIALGLIAATGALLHRYQTRHHLGAPGVRISPVPLIDSAGNLARSNSIPLPLAVPGWIVANEPVSATETSYLPQDTLFGRRAYIGKDGFRAFASVVLMGTDRTSIHRPEACLPGQGLVIERASFTNVAIARPHPYLLPVRRFDTTSQYEEDGKVVTLKWVFVYWFVTEGELTADHTTRMWSMARSLLTRGVLQRWAYVAYYARCNPGEEQATYERVSQLIAATVPDFQTTAGPAIR